MDAYHNSGSHQQSGVDFSYRARALRHKQAVKAFKQKQVQLEQQSQGLSKKKYWQQNVRTKEDAIKYFQLYYPEYPEVLVHAIISRLEKLLYKYNNEIGELTKEEKNMVGAFSQENEKSAHWDPVDDIEQQKLEGKIQLAQKRLEDLMKD